MDKITIVGAGKVGSTTAHIAATKHLGDIVLLDIIEGLAEGKALDIAAASPVQLYDSVISGTRDWQKTVDSNIVIITSGVPRGSVGLVRGIVRSPLKRHPRRPDSPPMRSPRLPELT